MGGGQVDDPGERVDLLRVFHRRTVRRWRFVADHGAHDRHVSVGTLPDGRWWVDDTGSRHGWIHDNEAGAWRHSADRRAARYPYGGRWMEVDPEPGRAGPHRSPGNGAGSGS